MYYCSNGASSPLAGISAYGNTKLDSNTPASGAQGDDIRIADTAKQTSEITFLTSVLKFHIKVFVTTQVVARSQNSVVRMNKI